MKELVKLTQLTRDDYNKLVIKDTWDQLVSAGMVGVMQVGERTDDVPSIIYCYNKAKDDWDMYALSNDIMEWNGTGRIIPTPGKPESMEDLINDLQNGGEITLAANIECPESISISADTELNLNGKTLKLSGDSKIINDSKLTLIGAGAISADKFAIVNNGELIIRMTGSIESKNSQALNMSDGSKLTIESGNFRAQESVVALVCANSEVIINGGRFDTTDNGVIMSNGSAGKSGNKVIINGGILNGRIQSEGYVACAIYLPNDDILEVNGGEFNSENGCGILARAGHATINGGKFNCTGEATGKVGDSSVIVPCAPLVFDIRSNYPGLTDDAKIEVFSGEFRADVDAVQVISADGQEIDPSRIPLMGGKFTNNVSEFCSEGYECVELGERDFEVRLAE